MLNVQGTSTQTASFQEPLLYGSNSQTVPQITTILITLNLELTLFSLHISIKDTAYLLFVRADNIIQ